MKIGIISPIVFLGSTAEDPAYVLNDLVTGMIPYVRARELKNGLEVKAGIDIYEYQGEDMTPPAFNESGNYNIGDIVLYNYRLHKITGKSGLPTHLSTRPKEPEEYGGWDTDMNFDRWSHRYLRIPNTSLHEGTIGDLGRYKNRWYYIFWEDRSHHPNCGWRFSAKDIVTPFRENVSPPGWLWYWRTCLKNGTSYKYDAAKDFKAVIKNFGAPGGGKVPTVNCRNLIIRGEYAYLRTHLDLPVEYVSNTIGSTIKYSLTEVKTPMDIDGFVYKRKISALSVFDKKSYTKCEDYPEDGKVSFTFQNTENFDSIALSRVIADTVDIHITDQDGNSMFELSNYPIYNELSNDRFEQPVTAILYTDKVIKNEAIVTVTLNGNHISLGGISVGDTLDFGYTNLEFNNDYRDFSPFSQDQWGNIEYKDGVRVKKFYGTVDLRIRDYDQIVRTMDAVGGNEVIINGSDCTNNSPANSISIFQATMMVGRFKSIKLKTSSRTNKIDDISTYSFEIEERV